MLRFSFTAEHKKKLNADFDVRKYDDGTLVVCKFLLGILEEKTNYFLIDFAVLHLGFI